ncbi:MAG TPA: hypothetical protein VFW33_06575 [Gemmataceae bacterium]|nr:hypothetical protein [Gemmataceae bacterium]
MSEPTLAREAAPPEARRRKLLAVAGVLGLVAAVAAAAVFVLHKKAPPAAAPPPAYFDDQLRDAIARVDQLDPGWRFADLEAAREKVPAAENAAPLVMAVTVLLPPALTTTDHRLTDRLRAHLRKGSLDDDQRKQYEAARAALFEGRKLAGFSRGRHAIKWDVNNPLATPLTVPVPLHLQATEAVTDLLALDAEVLAHDDKPDEALVSIRAALVAAHTVGDEPLLRSQVTRLGWQNLCAESLEEVLRHGRGSDEKLLGVQRALEAEAAAPVMRLAARAERAGLHGLLTAMENGELSREELPLLGVRGEGASLVLGRRRETLEAIHAALLDYTTRFVEVADAPPAEQATRAKELAAAPLKGPPETLPLLSALPVRDIVETCQKAQARLRCAAAAVAAERYRLATGRWPDDLAALVPKYLGAVPADPFDGKPLGYAPGKLDATVYAAGSVAFRLSNPESRGKPK